MGSRGAQVYLPTVRGPVQEQVRTFARSIAKKLAEAHPDIITAEYRVVKRPERHVLADPSLEGYFSDIERWARSPKIGREYISSREAFTIMKIDITSKTRPTRSCR